MRWRHLPAPARAVAAAAEDAVAAATAGDREALEAAIAALAGADGAGLVLGTVVRFQLEELHPDGLDGDDVRHVLEETVRSALPWMTEVDPALIGMLLASALGVHDPDEQAPPAPAALARNAALLVAHLATLGREVGAVSLAGHLDAAFAEIRRTELQD